MTIDSDAPAAIAQLATQLQACAAWVAAGGTAADIYYPRADYIDVSTIAAVLERTSETVTRPFEGVTIVGGTLEIELHFSDSVANTEDLTHDIANQICTDVGLAQLQVVGIETATEASQDKKSGNYNLTASLISLTYGLES